MHLAQSSSTSFCLWTGLSLPVALHLASQRRSYLQLRTGQCSRPERTFTLLLVRTFRRTYCCPSGTKVVVPLLRGKISQITADLKGATLFQFDVADRPARLFTPWSHAGLKRETDLRHQPNAPRG